MPRPADLHTSTKTLPIGAFMQIMETGNLFLLRKKGQPSMNQLQAAWDAVMDEYLQTFGIPSGYAQYLDLMTKAAGIWNAIYNKGQRWRKAEAMMAEAQARQLMEPEAGKMRTQIAAVSRFAGFRIDPNAVTVDEFYNYLELMKDGR